MISLSASQKHPISNISSWYVSKMRCTWKLCMCLAANSRHFKQLYQGSTALNSTKKLFPSRMGGRKGSKSRHTRCHTPDKFTDKLSSFTRVTATVCAVPW